MPEPEAGKQNQSQGDNGWLLRAAQEIAGEIDIGRLAQRLCPWLIGRDGVVVAGMAVVDAEVDLLTAWTFTADEPVATVGPVQYGHGPLAVVSLNG